MKEPKFSIIVPCYKVEKWIRPCLDSVLTQSFADWEMICVDDGSPDATGAILDEYAAQDPRIKVIHQENKGVSVARNVGLDHATGEWIWFIDSDDSIAPFALSYLARELRKSPVDIFQLGKQDVPSQNASFPVEEHPVVFYDLTNDEDIRVLARQDRLDFVLWESCLRRSVISGLRFREGLQLGEDNLFTTQALVRSSTLATTQTLLYNYVQRPGSCLNTMNLVKLRCSIESFALILETFRAWSHGSVALPLQYPFKRLRNKMYGTLDEIRRHFSCDCHRFFPRYCEIGVSVFDGHPLHQAVLRTHCLFFVLLFLYWPWKMRVCLLKFGIVSRVKAWVRERSAVRERNCA